MGDGDEVRVGAVRLVVVETPGHSAESISILQRNGSRVADLVGGLAAWEAARLPTAAAA
jgi:glyoxylase-like metal-dependent hydrolase (beta-lactamase superfamily II)